MISRREAEVDPHRVCARGFYEGVKLEEEYVEPFGAAVLAYRQFPDGLCNIHFALAAFEEIQRLGPCEAVALDARGFFDSLGHGFLKRAWCDLLGVERLPDDHFAVFKSVTRDSAILLPDLRKIFGDVRRRAGREGARICSPKDFREKVRPLLRPRFELVARIKGDSVPDGPVGIAQGTPISAILANVYMRKVDELLFAQMQALGGSYRRYSDDILLIVPPGVGLAAALLVEDALKEVGLSISDDKTCRVGFSLEEERLVGRSLDRRFAPHGRQSLDYLGLSFDGESLRLRHSTVSRFMIRMVRGVRRAEIAASKNHQPIKRRKLYACFSKWWMGKAYASEKAAPRRGFHHYVKRASAISGSEAIARQGRQLHNQLHRIIQRAEKRLAAESPP